MSGWLISNGHDRTGEYLWIHDDVNRTKFLANLSCGEENITFDKSFLVTPYDGIEIFVEIKKYVMTRD